MNDTKFRRIYLTHPWHNIGEVSKHTNAIDYCTKGGELSLEEMVKQIENSLRDFDPLQDAIVPIGSVKAAMLVGIALKRFFDGQLVTIGVFHKTYKGNYYEWVEVAV